MDTTGGIMMKKAKQAKQAFDPALSSTGKDKTLYCLGAVGSNMTWMVVSSFLTIYYTNCAHIPALFIGNMMLACRVLDGITDIIAGTLIDKTNSRLGKARPWFMFTFPFVCIGFALMFTVPGSADAMTKEAYATVTYVLFTAVFYTLNNIAYQALLPRFSPTSQDRVAISSLKTVIAYISILAVSMATTILLGQLGGMDSQGAWTRVIAVYAVIAALSFIFPCFVHETAGQTEDSRKSARQSVPLRKSLGILLRSKYFYICVILFLTYYITSGTSSVGIYYATYVLHNANLYGIISLASMVPSIVIMPFMPKYFKRFGKRNAMRIGLVVAIASCLATLINPSNLGLFIGMSLLRSIGSLPMTAAMFTLAGDLVDYNEMKSGIRTEGLTTSANGIGQKIGTGLGSAFLGWGLAIGSFNENVEIQSDSAVRAIIFIMLVLPAITFTISLVLVSFWDLEKYQADILNFRKARGQVNHKG